MEKAQSGFYSKKSDFRKYWIGQTISNLGSSMTIFAIPLLVYKTTQSALDLGIASAATMLPYLLFGLILGAWTDRTDRKRMMIVSDVGRAVVIATIPLLALSGALSIWWMYLVGFLHSVFTICFTSSEFAAIPSLVDQRDLVAANGRIQASYALAGIIGPALAGSLTVFLSVPFLLLFDALSFLLSAFFLALIATDFATKKEEQKEQKSILQDVIEGLRYVWGHPVLRNISLMMTLVNFVLATQGAQLVLFAKDRLLASDAQVGLLYTAGGIGMVVFSLLADELRKRWTFSAIALGSLMCMGFFICALAFIRWYWLAFVLIALIQGNSILFNITTGSLRQAIVPNQLLGRVMSIASVLAWSSIPLGSLLGGSFIAQTRNVALVYGVIGVLVMLIPLSFCFTPLARAERYLPDKEASQGRAG